MSELRYFILQDKQGRPSKISMGIYSDGKKIKGEAALPPTLDNVVSFADLNEVRRARCTCSNPRCLFTIYLAQAINRFNEQMKNLL